MVAITVDRAVQDVGALPALVTDSVRSVDVVWEDAANVYVVMPETGRDRALGVIGRVTRRIPHLDFRSVRVAVFPDDATTAGALLDVLNGSDGETTVTADHLLAASPITRLVR
jgi:hypothetical protein